MQQTFRIFISKSSELKKYDEICVNLINLTAEQKQVHGQKILMKGRIAKGRIFRGGGNSM